MDENLIGEVIGMSTKGTKLFRDRKFSDKVVIRFPRK